MQVLNIYDGVPEELPEELQETILRGKSFRIERIVSRGHASAAGAWYDQEESEFVILLRGSARISFDGPDGPESVDLRPGDYLDIPAHTRHRVEKTAPGEDTVWLAVHHS